MRGCRLSSEDSDHCRARAGKSKPPQRTSPRGRIGKCVCQRIEPSVIHVRSPPTSIGHAAHFRYDNPIQARSGRSALALSEILRLNTRESARAPLTVI
jgi:hypothetical protein